MRTEIEEVCHLIEEFIKKRSVKERERTSGLDNYDERRKAYKYIVFKR